MISNGDIGPQTVLYFQVDIKKPMHRACCSEVVE